MRRGSTGPEVLLIPLLLMCAGSMWLLPKGISLLIQRQFLKGTALLMLGLFIGSCLLDIVAVHDDNYLTPWIILLTAPALIAGLIAQCIWGVWAKSLSHCRFQQRLRLPDEPTNVIPFVVLHPHLRSRVMSAQGFRCANPYCNTDLRDCIPHWDHIQPRARGGTDSLHNMQYLCQTCNTNKSDKPWPEFLIAYAKGLGQDPRINQKPWQNWAAMRANNGLGHGT